ncbi:MAG: Wzz/FepE/Etk N-terminal domain-containing protein [Patescibacteria group bacterium]
MPTSNLVHIMVRRWRTIGIAALIGLVLALGFSLIQPLRYSSSVRLLITQTNVTGLDPYTAIKSTERIAQNLSEVVYTSSFFNAVMANESIDRNYFPTDEISKRQKWQDTIATSVVPDTGIMVVTAYHTSREQAQDLSLQVAQQISTQAPNYFGYSVRVQVIDDPLPSRFFAKPDFLRNGLMGLVAGFLIGTAWILGKVRD